MGIETGRFYSGKISAAIAVFLLLLAFLLTYLALSDRSDWLLRPGHKENSSCDESHIDMKDVENDLAKIPDSLVTREALMKQYIISSDCQRNFYRDQNKLPDHRLEFIKWTWIVALAVAFIAGSNLKSYSNILTDQLVEVKVKLAKDPGNENLIRRQAQLEIQLSNRGSSSERPSLFA